MKKILCFILAAAAFMLLSAGCTKFLSQTSSMQIRSESKNNSSTATYDYRFSSKDESETHIIDFQESGSVRIKLSSSVKNGEVYFALKDDDDKIIYEESGKKFSFNESFTLDEGLYTITFHYDKAEKGNIKLEVYSNCYFEYYNGKGDDNETKDDK